MLLFAGLLGCWFTDEEVERAAEAAAPPTVDVLLVIDTSGSMKEEASALALGLDAVVAGLGDADWQLGVTTVTADYGAAGTAGIDPGEAGTLVGPVVASADADPVAALRSVLLCDTIYWRDSDLASDPAYVVGDTGDCPAPVDEVVREYLDCVCGAGGWVTEEGAGNEEGLEAVFDALCRAGDDQPEDCWSEDSPLTEGDAGTNADLWRDGVPGVALLVSDEGDGSRRQANTDPDPTPYVELFAATGRDFRLYVVGPTYDGSDGSCLDSAQTWGVERYQAAAEATGGDYASLTDIDDDCSANDVAAAAADFMAQAVD
mgnify:CR=1 FL=1